ncbi:MAG: hypothetical protein HQL73_06535 [Magnetococcales bacterium]|nr:hypothetical protein [Magnetococcales bacterium]
MMAIPSDKFSRIVRVCRGKPLLSLESLLSVEVGYSKMLVDSHGHGSVLPYSHAVLGLYHESVGPSGFLDTFAYSFLNHVRYYIQDGDGVEEIEFDASGVHFRAVGEKGPVAVGNVNGSYSTPVYHANPLESLNAILGAQWNAIPFQFTAAELRALTEPWDFRKYLHPGGLLVAMTVSPYGRSICIKGNPYAIYPNPYNNYPFMFDLIWKYLAFIHTPPMDPSGTEPPTTVYKPSEFDLPVTFPPLWSSGKIEDSGDYFLSHAVNAYGLGPYVAPYYWAY